ncbi:MAG: SOS response-associated peptidase [Candidatus Hydrogenedentes bacterium]|nr:SOS response-associated peptidase [Candidatus Hydrogenedentota bacterium]
MCGRYIFAKNRKDLLRRFGLDKDFDEHGAGIPVYSLPLFNIAPTNRVPVIVMENGRRVLRLMAWGLIPPWSDSPKMQSATFNARAEGIATSRLYRGPFASRRCLVPSTGFYEWSGPAKVRVPHCIQKGDGEIFSFAGVWDRWQSRDRTQSLESFSIVTTAANAFVSAIHDRMPAILDEVDEARWLDPATPPDECLSLLKPYAAADLHMHRVSNAVNKAGVEGPELAAPVAKGLDETLPAQLNLMGLD